MEIDDSTGGKGDREEKEERRCVEREKRERQMD